MKCILIIPFLLPMSKEQFLDCQFQAVEGKRIPYFLISCPKPSETRPVSLYLRTEKSFRNFIKSYRNQIIFTILRLIQNQTDVGLVPNQKENDKYYLISVLFNYISKIFLCVQYLSKALNVLFSFLVFQQGFECIVQFCSI